MDSTSVTQLNDKLELIIPIMNKKNLGADCVSEQEGLSS